MAIPFILILFFDCCPSAIGWFVVALIVFALKSVLHRGPLAHISKEVFKSMNSAPPITDCNAASPIVGIIGAVRVQASPQHRPPCDVGRGIGLPMLNIPFAAMAQKIAATTNRVAAYKLSRGALRCFAACAGAEPQNSTLRVATYNAHHGEQIKCFASQVFEWPFYRERLESWNNHGPSIARLTTNIAGQYA